MTNPSIALLIDQSGSMGSGYPDSPYLPYAQTDAATFVNIMNVGDALGVVAFNNNISQVFPTSGSAAVVIAGQTTQNQATTAINGLTASGLTNINGAIGMGMTLLSGVGTPKALILLSDGAANVGVTDPTKMTVPSYPIHTIALGNHGQISTLQTLATRTGGTYYSSPSPFDLSKIYNDIVQQSSVAATLANNAQQLSQNSFKITSATFPGGAPSGTFTVSWGNAAVSYTPNTPTGNQVNVSLQDPNGHAVSATAAAVGPGYVVFRVPNPIAGVYQAAVWYSGTATLPATTGVFNPDMSLQLSVAFNTSSVTTGDALEFSAVVLDNGQVVPNVQLSVALQHPLISNEATLIAHRSRLERIRTELNEKGDSEISDNTLMWLLQSRLGPTERLQPYGHCPVSTDGDAGTYHGKIATAASGAHLLHLRATGTSPHSGRSFSLERCISAWVA